MEKTPSSPVGLVAREMPTGLIVRDIAAAAPSPNETVPTGMDPYRGSPPETTRPGLEIGWTSGDDVTQSLAWVLLMLTALTAIVAPALLPGWVVAISAGALIAIGLWLLRHSSERPMFVRADASGLTWKTRGRISFYRRRSLPASKVRQLFVRSNPLGLTPTFVVVARDHRDRDHDIWSFESLEQALWIEERVEAHLRIANLRVDHPSSVHRTA